MCEEVPHPNWGKGRADCTFADRREKIVFTTSTLQVDYPPPILSFFSTVWKVYLLRHPCEEVDENALFGLYRKPSAVIFK